MARANYEFEKRKRELLRKQKQEAKRLRKEERKKQQQAAEAAAQPLTPDAAPGVEGIPSVADPLPPEVPPVAGV